jgi:lipopolysaccharide export system protein LptA
LIILSSGLYGQNEEEILPADSLELVAKMDSIAQNKAQSDDEKSVLDHEVIYDAVDSMYFDLTKNEVYLYGEAMVKYGDITLTAYKIAYNFDNYSVVAEGGLDTAGNVIGTPSFKQKKESFEAKKITYNFETEKGYIQEVRTEIADAYVHAKVSKKQPNNAVHIKGGFFTTCDKEKPHFGFKTTKMIVIPDDKVVTGPGYLVFFNKIPIPIGLPFALIPDQNKKASGIIMPTYGDAVSTKQGFYLRNGGYYWAINDYFHTAIKGSIYANGSWGLTSESNYIARYKFSGNLNLIYEDFIIGGKEDINSGATQSKSFNVTWRHTQDSKASQYSSFNSNVNFVSGGGYRNNVNSSTQDYINKNLSSNISYRYIIPNSPFNLSLSTQLSQVLDPNSTTVNSTNDLTLPKLTFNMKRIDLPLSFLKKNRMGKKKWYEKIGMTYTLNAENRLKYNQAQLDTTAITSSNFEELFNVKNGLKHNATLSTSFSFKTISISPNIRTSGNWYFRRYEKYLDPVELVEVTDTIKEFSQVWNVSGGVNLTGKLYGMYSFKGDGWLKAMRHQITGSAGVSYSPGVSTQQFGYVGDDGAFVSYNPYQGSIYAPPNSKPANVYNFRLINDLEAKVKSKNDSITEYKKVKFINNLTLDASYDALRDSIKWSDIRMSGRFTQLFEVLNINYSAVFDPYGYNSSAQKVNESWLNQTDKLVRMRSATLSATFGLKSKKRVKKVKPKNEAEQAIQEEFEENPGMFQNLNIPWDVNVSYNFNISNIPKSVNDSLYFENSLNNTIGIRGSFTLFDIFRISVNTGYDFVDFGWAPTLLSLYVDLHCWEFSASVRPTGGLQSYSFALNVKSPLLKDLKIKRESTFGGGSGFF